MLALKGFDVAEMSSIRGTAEGTVRAQLTRIYAKAGATSRPQFVSLFIDDLLAAPIIAGKVGGGEG
jgi:DNA-binding CsgD family transcriptional regulator